MWNLQKKQTKSKLIDRTDWWCQMWGIGKDKYAKGSIGKKVKNISLKCKTVGM